MPKQLGYVLLLSLLLLSTCLGQVSDTSPESLTTFRVKVCDTGYTGPIPCTIFGFKALAEGRIFVVANPSPYDLPTSPLILRTALLTSSAEAKNLTTRYVRAVDRMLSRIHEEAAQESFTITFHAPRFHFSLIHGQTIIEGSFDSSIKSDKCSDNIDTLECLHYSILRRLNFGPKELRQFESR